MNVKLLTYDEAMPLIINNHYASRVPSISFAVGLFNGLDLLGVVTFVSPASPFVCTGVCGPENKDLVLELNRLVLKDNKPNQASFLVANAIKKLPKPRVIVSYADTAQGHSGIVYQACNFFFCGTTKERTDMAAEDGKHPRHHAGVSANRVFRSSKHRYVFFHGSKKEKKHLRHKLRWTPLPCFPKGKKQNTANNLKAIPTQPRLI